MILKNNKPNPITSFFKVSISFIVIIVPSVYFGYIGKTAEMGIALIAGAIAAVFLNVDKFSRFKGAGFEAEMKKAVDEVYATIDNIGEIAKPLVITTFNILTFDGNWGGMNPETKYELSQKLDEIIDSFNLSDNEIKRTKHIFNKVLVKRFYSSFVSSLGQCEHNLSTELYELSKDDSYYPSKKDVEIILKKYNVSLSDINAKSNEILNKYLAIKKDLL